MKPLTLLLTALIIISTSLTFAQNETVPSPEPTPSVATKSAPAIKVSLTKEEPDSKGTDVTNIYTITVDFANETLITNDHYILAYNLDGQPQEKFTDQSLPFSFKRNFKGHENGTHEISIDIIDENENILSHGETTVTVIRNQQ